MRVVPEKGRGDFDLVTGIENMPSSFVASKPGGVKWFSKASLLFRLKAKVLKAGVGARVA